MTLRLLCDEHVDPELRKALEPEHDIAHVLTTDSLGAGATDPVIWTYAVERSYNVLTNDRDFVYGTTDQVDGHPGVIRYANDATIGEIVRALRVINAYVTSEQIAGSVFRVPGDWLWPLGIRVGRIGSR